MPTPPPPGWPGMLLPEPSPTGRHPAGPGWDRPKGFTWLTMAEAAQLIGVDYDGLRRLESEGELPAHHIGGLLRFRANEVWTYLEQAANPSVEPEPSEPAVTAAQAER